MNARCRDVDKDELFLSSREFLRLLDDAGTSKVVNPTRARLIFRRAQSADDEDDGDVKFIKNSYFLTLCGSVCTKNLCWFRFPQRNQKLLDTTNIK